MRRLLYPLAFAFALLAGAEPLAVAAAVIVVAVVASTSYRNK